MERNTHSKVYINPNFKRTEIGNWPKETIKTTHFNRHYLEEMPNRKDNINMDQDTSINNRKIYVNRNFIGGNNVAQSNLHIRQERKEFIEQNENLTTVFNPKQTLHKSKYSLVCNIQQTSSENDIKNKQPKKDMYNAISKTDDQKVTEEVKETVEQPLYTQEVPLTRSRYCIVRRKKKSSVNVEKSENNLIVNLFTKRCPAHGSFANKTSSSTNVYGIRDNEINKLSYKMPEKVTKIKLTKYKTIPIGYLKKNPFLDINRKKSSQSVHKSFTNNNAKLNSSTIIGVNKNRFKFIKTSTPTKVNVSSNISTIITASRVTQYANKNTSINRSKAQAKFNINNIPCRLFKKYGKCLRQERGDCKYLHDKKHVSLCRKFLKGICHDNGCALSHETNSKKMPTCYFYLNGMCTKESCPYLHVKLSDKTKLCQEFIKGYCESGDKCPFKHVMVESKVIKIATNTSSRKCSENRTTKSKQIKVFNKMENITNKNSDEKNKKDDKDCRYYKELVDAEASFETIKPKRCKLGTLPSFIQL